jgi:uncharacterized membrane protein (UPF0127 family)
MDQITVRNATKAKLIGTQIDLANTFLARLVGLLGKKRLDRGCGILIQPSCGVHTFGMLFAIDVVALDKDRQVLRTWSNLAPFRITGLSLSTQACLELAAGQVEACHIRPGDRLQIFPNVLHNHPTPAAKTRS